MAAFFGANEIWSRHEEDGREPVILAGVWATGSGRSDGSGYASEEEFYHSLDELAELARACMMEPAGVVTQQLPSVNAGLYVGTGKAEEIKELADANEAKRVIFNDTLSPSQIRNLQKALKLPVMDRTALILEIFERRARTREAKLQVELAKLRYLKPRLIGLWETQNRQGGTSGSMSAKGEGETQLEIDRRTVDHRLSDLTRELKVVSRERETQRKKRQGSGLPLVALVGYTNAGKSTIMNAMLDRYVGGAGRYAAARPEAGKAGMNGRAADAPGENRAAGNRAAENRVVENRAADAPGENRAAENRTADSSAEGNPAAENRKVFEADMLFATLDTTVRRITVERGKEFLLSDTVGFIHKLPTALIEAFKSTLEEVTQADLLLQVVDGSDPHCREHIEVTKKTIGELGAGHIPMITIFNKADLLDDPVSYPRSALKELNASEFRNENIYISAKDPSSIEFLTDVIFERLMSGSVVREFLIPYDKGHVVSYLMEKASVEKTEYEAEGTRLTVRCEAAVADRAEKMLG